MENNGKVTELYRKYRPRRFKDVLGQPEAVAVLEEMVKNNRVPHALLFSGSSGVGKTTIARIMAAKLGCDKLYCKEYNFAESRGIDTVREIDEDAKMPPLGDAKVKFWILDEIARGTGDSLSALLKILEDPKDHAYYALCTTDPQKLPKTLRTRCTEIRLNSLDGGIIGHLVKDVCVKESIKISDVVLEKIVECSECSARQALVLLGKICGLPGEQEMLAAIHRPDTERNAYDLAKALVWDRGVRWKDIQKILSELVDEDWEQLRHLIRANATIELLKPSGNAARAGLVLECFQDTVMYTGRSGIAQACWAVKSESESK